MKVLHMTTHLNMGGITIYILRLAKYLKLLGIETCVFSSGGELETQFEKQGAHLFNRPVKTKSELHPKLYLQIPFILKLIRDEKISILHAHTRTMQVLALCIKKITGIPVVTTCHGFYKRRLGRRLYPAWGDHAIAISHLVKEHLVKDFEVKEDLVTTIHNGIDIDELDRSYAKHDRTRIRELYGIAPDAPVIVMIARLVEDKGHEYLIRAISELKKEFPEIKALIVGDGKHRNVLKALSSELGVDENIIFTGNILDITQPLIAADIFAFPAVWREGFGLSIMEAMCCRKPVIATKIWALSLLIQDGVTGLLIEPRQIKPLVEAVRSLIASPELCHQLGCNGRQMVLDFFSMENMSKEMARLYKNVTLHKHS